MLRIRLACLKPIALALLAMFLLLSALEIGLRVHHSYRIQSQADPAGEQGLAMPSWKVHHALKPLKSTVHRNADTRLPIPIRTNSLGLRGGPIAVPKPSDVFRIVYLGDETVFAPDVLEEDSFCKLIEVELSRHRGKTIEVINAGTPGYCPLLSYLQFKHALSSLQPDLLVLNFDLSDVADDHHYRRHARLASDDSPLLCTHPQLQPSPTKSPQFVGHNLLVLQACKDQLGLLPADEGRTNDTNQLETEIGRYAWTREARPAWEIYISQALSPIRNLQELANQLSCPLIVTISPAPWQISSKAMSAPGSREKWGIAPDQMYEAKLAIEPVRQFLEAHRIPFCDPTERFLAHHEPASLFLETMPRFSRTGHRFFAEVICDSLKQSLLADPASPPSTPSFSGRIPPMAGRDFPGPH